MFRTVAPASVPRHPHLLPRRVPPYPATIVSAGGRTDVAFANIEATEDDDGTALMFVRARFTPCGIGATVAAFTEEEAMDGFTDSLAFLYWSLLRSMGQVERRLSPSRMEVSAWLSVWLDSVEATKLCAFSARSCERASSTLPSRIAFTNATWLCAFGIGRAKGHSMVSNPDNILCV